MSFVHYGNYECVCGANFTDSQRFNSHKANCAVHLDNCGKLEARKLSKSKAAETGRRYLSMYAQVKHNNKLMQWIDEKHTCEKCGKIMTEYYGSGRFCSRACANSHKQSPEQNKRRSEKLTGRTESLGTKNRINYKQRKLDYYNNPSKCSVCNEPLSYECRNHKTCGKDSCYREHLSNVLKQHHYEIYGKPVEGRHIVYKVTSLIDGRYYIGVRKTDVEFDGYLGSGVIIRNLVKKYGRENFKRETLFEFNNSTDAYSKEKELLRYHLKQTKCVNLADGGQGGKTH